MASAIGLVALKVPELVDVVEADKQVPKFYKGSGEDLATRIVNSSNVETQYVTGLNALQPNSLEDMPTASTEEVESNQEAGISESVAQTVQAVVDKSEDILKAYRGNITQRYL